MKNKFKYKKIITKQRLKILSILVLIERWKTRKIPLIFKNKSCMLAKCEMNFEIFALHDKKY